MSTDSNTPASIVATTLPVQVAETQPTAAPVAAPVVVQQPAKQTAQQTTAAKPFSFDEKKFQEVITDVEKFYLEFAGKPNHNPHIYLQKEVDPLVAKFKGGDRSEALFTAAGKLQKKAPILDPNWKPEVLETIIGKPKGLDFGSKNVAQR